MSLLSKLPKQHVLGRTWAFNQEKNIVPSTELINIISREEFAVFADDEKLQMFLDMLEVLGRFQKGDAERIRFFIEDDYCPDSGEYPHDCSLCCESAKEICEVLKRMEEAARLMEAEG